MECLEKPLLLRLLSIIKKDLGIQKQFGYKSPQMTMHYIKAVDTDIDEEIEFLSSKLKKF